jgi:hypothetical protein
MGQTVKRTIRRIAVMLLAAAQILEFIAARDTRAHYAFASGGTATCPTVQTNYAAGGTLGSGLNTYWQPAAGTLAAGATSLPLGTLDATGGSSSTGVSTGDELLIIQMQDGAFNTSNSSSYGDGTGSGHGSTSIANAGLYEYVFVTNATAGQTSGSVTIQGAGSGGGLINSYYENASNNQRYQIVRVPEYTTATLSGNFTARYWDGNTGGVAAIDMASTLNLNGASVYATGDGFRGGAYSVASTTPASVLNSDYADSATMNGAGKQPGFGTKGEGINGSPHALFYYTTYTTPSAPAGPTVNPTPGGSDGYTGGDQGMGAPGNAGGGGTDDDPVSNDQNTGGGGGGNGGAGGNGGYPWTPNYSTPAPGAAMYSQLGLHTGANYSTANSGDLGGRGGAALNSYVSVGRAFMGGGGGAGSNNNNSDDSTNNPYGKYGSSGGVGGGIVLMRLADTSGTPATIYANGTTGLAPNNDGGGGGGAGGTVILTSPNAFTGITVNVNGAAGTTADASGSFPANQHGPGGGGGGGIVLSSSTVSASALGGVSGTTTPSLTTYGATNGASGYTSQAVSSTAVPGVASGAECYSSGTSGSGTIYTGPYDSVNGGANDGADFTGSYDGQVGTTNDNDFTARAIPLTNASPSPLNTSTSALAPVGSTFSVSSAPSIDVENGLYYKWTSSGKYMQLNVNAAAPLSPSGWSVQLCPDNGGAPNCGYNTGTGSCSKKADRNLWMDVGAAGSTSTIHYCYYSTAANYTAIVPYWAVYVGPTGTYTAFARYDGLIAATDSQGTPALNKTHNELYAGFIPIAKTSTTLSNGNCKGFTVPAQGVCPGGTIQYSLQYANIVAGGGLGTEGQDGEPFIESGAGSLVVSDDGKSGLGNWGSYTGGLLSAVTDTTAGTACTYNSGGAFVAGATQFSCTVGGSAFQLYPQGFSGKTSSGTLTFQVTAK